MNKKELHNSVNHIETIHRDMYNLTELRWFRANEKRLVRICENKIKELEADLKYEKKQRQEYKEKFKAYDRVVKQLEKTKEKIHS